MEDLVGKALNQNFVPVLDDQKCFIGIITRKDIIKYFYQKCASLQAALPAAGEAKAKRFVAPVNAEKKETAEALVL